MKQSDRLQAISQAAGAIRKLPLTAEQRAFLLKRITGDLGRQDFFRVLRSIFPRT